MTASELLEQLRSLPPNTPILVEGYETGLDLICSLRQAVVHPYRRAQEWDGEYREAQVGESGGMPAAVLLGRRGQRR